MPAEPCLVTVRAGPAASKGYENFVSNKLQDEVLKEIESNLQDDLKEDALTAFKETVSQGWSIKDCICKVQNEVLPKVPNERNKFFIKFTYDNQLQIEIGVNKFKNGNAQFYHRIGVAPKQCPEMIEQKQEKEKRKATMEELRSAGYFPSIKLKRQVTNDKSAPFVSVEVWGTINVKTGKVSNPRGGWDDADERDADEPPNPTNMQTARAGTGWAPEQPRQTRSSRPRALGDLFRNQKPNTAKLRCRSVGRPQRQPSDEKSPDVRDRSISPLNSRGKGRGALGDCFRTGIRPSKAMLRAGGGQTACRDTLNTGSKISIRKEDTGNITKNMMKHITIQVQNQNNPEKLEDSEWDENCVEIEEMSSSEEDITEDKNTPEQVSCEQKKSIFITEATPEPSYSISQPSEQEFKKVDTPFHEEYPIQNMRKFNLPDQSIFSKKINPLPPLEDFDGWHGPILERTRTVPKKCFGKLELSCQLNQADKSLDAQVQNRGWVSIPIQRL